MTELTFDGTFELAFLLDNEAVRKSQADTDVVAVEVIDKYSDRVIARVRMGETIYRENDGGLTVIDNEWPEEFE